LGEKKKKKNSEVQLSHSEKAGQICQHGAQRTIIKAVTILQVIKVSSRGNARMYILNLSTFFLFNNFKQIRKIKVLNSYTLVIANVLKRKSESWAGGMAQVVEHLSLQVQGSQV
jgi:hypothetical protein